MPEMTITLLCDGKNNPDKLLNISPKLSWKVDEVGDITPIETQDVQTFYQVMVSDDSKVLTGNILDTGKVESPATIVDYKSLKHSTTYYWKVKVWMNKDVDEKESSVATITVASLQDRVDATNNRKPESSPEFTAADIIKEDIENSNDTEQSQIRKKVDRGIMLLIKYELKSPSTGKEVHMEREWDMDNPDLFPDGNFRCYKIKKITKTLISEGN